MWLISWAITPSSSSRFMIVNSPVVAAMAACRGLVPVAKAFGDGSSITYPSGLGRPSPMAKASTTLCSWRHFVRVSGPRPSRRQDQAGTGAQREAIPASANTAAAATPTATSRPTGAGTPADERDTADHSQPTDAPIPTQTMKNNAM
jgi:hypothetical protein